MKNQVVSYKGHRGRPKGWSPKTNKVLTVGQTTETLSITERKVIDSAARMLVDLIRNGNLV